MSKIKLIRSSVRRVGGKSKLIKIISQYFPEEFDKYYEPFVGGGSVLFYTKQNYKNKIKKYWINDLDYPLYCFFRQLRDNGIELHNFISVLKMQYKDNGRELYEIYKPSIENENMFNQAVRFFILNKVSFSGLTESGTFSQMAFDSNFSQKSIDNLLNMIPILQEVDITNLSYEKLLDINDKDTFIYLDSPYYGVVSKMLYGKNGSLHKHFDFELYAKRLKECNAKWCVSLDNTDYIKNLFKDFAYIHEIEVGSYAMNNNSTQRKEFVITNYKTKFTPIK